MQFFGKIPVVSSFDFRTALARVARVFSIEALCSGETADLARAALKSAGKFAQRSSPLQPLFVFWFVLCLPIFRGDSIPALLARLMQALRDRIRDLPLHVVTDGAIAHARRRLGIRAMRLFFHAVARRSPCRPSFHGLRVKVIDGVRLDLPDTPANVGVFGRPSSHRGPSAYSQLLAVVLLDAVTRGPLDVKIASYKGSERACAGRLLRSVADGDVLLLDRGLFGLPLFRAIRAKNAHFLVRAPACVRLDPIDGKKARRSGDYQAVLHCRVPLDPGERRGTHMGRPGKTKEVEMTVRVIEYRVRGFKPVRLVTSLLDTSIQAEEIIRLYHRRWEIELAFDEAKTVQAAPAKGTLQTQIRSKTPRGVFQEVYALLASYALVRQTIAAAAAEHAIAPEDVGFADALRAIKVAIHRMAGARTEDLPRLFRQMLADVAACRLTRPRRRRRYPRVMKRKIGKFPLKRPGHGALPPLDPAEAFRARHRRGARVS
jgi:hypothetical protein